ARTFDKNEAGRRDMLEWIRKGNARHYNIYFSVGDVSSALDRNHVKAKREEITTVVALHADIDCKVTPGEKMETAKAARIEAVNTNVLIPPPSIIVDSGGGIQCYWLLAKSIKVTDANRDDIEARNKQIAEDVGGDAVQNVDRIMRVPGTINWPDE